MVATIPLPPFQSHNYPNSLKPSNITDTFSSTTTAASTDIKSANLKVEAVCVSEMPVQTEQTKTQNMTSLITINSVKTWKLKSPHILHTQTLHSKHVTTHMLTGKVKQNYLAWIRTSLSVHYAVWPSCLL